MNCYEIALPNVRNADTKGFPRSYALERGLWEQEALNAAGGYTCLGNRFGVWRDDDGHVYREGMHWYQIACDKATIAWLLDHAFELFPDQKAIYVVQVGVATIVPRVIGEPEPAQ